MPLILQFPFTEIGVCVKVVAAVEINTTANRVYKYNFPDTNLQQKNIEVSWELFTKIAILMLISTLYVPTVI